MQSFLKGLVIGFGCFTIIAVGSVLQARAADGGVVVKLEGAGDVEHKGGEPRAFVPVCHKGSEAEWELQAKKHNAEFRRVEDPKMAQVIQDNLNKMPPPTEYAYPYVVFIVNPNDTGAVLLFDEAHCLGIVAGPIPASMEKEIKRLMTPNAPPYGAEGRDL